MARIAVRHMRESADNRELLQSTSIDMRHKVPWQMRVGLIIRPVPSALSCCPGSGIGLYSRRRSDSRRRSVQATQWGDGVGGRRQDKALANQGKARLRQFRLQKLILRTGKEVGIGSCEGGHKMMHRDGFPVE